MVIHSKLFLQLLIAVLDPKPFMKDPDHLYGWFALRHVAEKIAELKPFSFVPASFYDEPDLLVDTSLILPYQLSATTAR